LKREQGTVITSATRISKLISQQINIESQSAKETEAIAYMARILVLATLPHSKPKENIFQRTNGNLSITMMANPKFGLPYGSFPRLFLAWLVREAKLKKSLTLQLGTSFSSFLKILKLSDRGGIRGDATRMREQMIRLLTTNISCVYHNKKQGVCQADQFLMARSFDFWWNPLNENSDKISSQSTITLSKDFYDEIIHRAVPVDFRVLRALSRSPLQIDLYVWLTHRFSYLKRSTSIGWFELSQQFGSNYNLLKDFKREFVKGLHIVKAFYPAANIEIENEGVRLNLSPTHIQLKSKNGRV